jgi:2-methylfumaryl-CoA hydratase
MLTPTYGRMLDDFAPGETYAHPWEVTISEGMTAMFAASFLDAIPTFASKEVARQLGFKDRPVSPLLLLNLALSFSVHDVSEQAIAHLAYLDVRFPEPAFAGDTVSSSSKVLAVKPSSGGDRGVVHVKTVLQNQHGSPLCTFERLALVRSGKVRGRPEVLAFKFKQPNPAEIPHLPPPLRDGKAKLKREPRFGGLYEDLEIGDVYAHVVGRTVGDSEHMQLTTLLRNTHPLHVDEVYCEENSFANKRVVYGGLVLGWVLALATRDVGGNALWEMGLDQGAHPSPVLAGDTLYAASKVVAKHDVGPEAGAVTFRVIGMKNLHPSQPLADGIDPFAPELSKKDGKIAEKVVEITRTLLVRKCPS